MPFLFKNKENNKWISFENNSTSYNNRNITLTECKECDENTVSAGMPDSTSDSYMIKLDDTDNCLFPNDNDELISGDCSTFSNNQVYEMKKMTSGYLDQVLPNQLQVSITFNDNRTANINGSTRNWGKQLTKLSHTYNSSSDSSKTKIYDILKDSSLYSGSGIIQNATLRDFLTENISVRCKLFHVIEEYNSSDSLIAKTIYRLKFINKTNIGDITDDTISGIIMYVNSNESELLNSSSEQNDIVISYSGKRNYSRDNMSDNNEINFSKAHIGTILSGTPNYGYINTNHYNGGIIIKQTQASKTNFRVIMNDSIFNRMINYSYPEQEIGSSENITLNMSSYVNPRKKIFIKNNLVISKNLRDGTEKNGSNFNITPVSESFSLYEGYSNEYSFQDEITTLNNMLTSPTPFNNIISQIEKILDNINTSNTEGEYAHIVNIYKTDLENIKYCFNIAKSLYANISVLHKNMIDNYMRIGLNNVYGVAGNGTEMVFDDNTANKVIQQLNTLKKEVSATKSQLKKNFDKCA